MLSHHILSHRHSLSTPNIRRDTRQKKPFNLGSNIIENLKGWGGGGGGLTGLRTTRQVLTLVLSRYENRRFSGCPNTVLYTAVVSYIPSFFLGFLFFFKVLFRWCLRWEWGTCDHLLVSLWVLSVVLVMWSNGGGGGEGGEHQLHQRTTRSQCVQVECDILLPW